MLRGHKKQSFAFLLVLTTLAMRAAIPEGFMPSALGSGLLYELCPSAVPAEVMQVLRANKGHGGHHAHHQQPNHTDHSKHDGNQCEIGHLLASAVAVDTSWQTPLPPPVTVHALPVAIAFNSSTRTSYASRDPPA
jgi:hypothetical protein